MAHTPAGLDPAQPIGFDAQGGKRPVVAPPTHLKRIAAAGLDVTREEPLPASSPLWALPNAFITSHVAGETQRYEDSVIDILLENLDRQWRGETALRNQIV